jgi:hypothetical protein
LTRDGEEARDQWEAWIASEDLYRESEHPEAAADIVISGEHDLWH